MWPLAMPNSVFFIGRLLTVCMIFFGLMAVTERTIAMPGVGQEDTMETMEDDAMRSVNVQHRIIRYTDSGPRDPVRTPPESWRLLSEKSMAAITGAGAGDDESTAADMDLSDAMSDFDALFRLVEPELVEDEKWDADQAPVQFRATVNDLHGELLALVEDEWIVVEKFKVPRSYFGYMGFEKYGWELEYEVPVKKTIETDIRFRYRTGVDGRPVKLEFLIDQYSEELRRDPPLVDYEIYFEGGGKLLLRGRTWNIRSGHFAIWQYAD